MVASRPRACATRPPERDSLCHSQPETTQLHLASYLLQIEGETGSRVPLTTDLRDCLVCALSASVVALLSAANWLTRAHRFDREKAKTRPMMCITSWYGVWNKWTEKQD